MSDDVIKLPEVNLLDTFPLLKSIHNRRSVRKFNGDPITVAELSALLWSCQGITDNARSLRAAPSAGACFPFSAYVVMEQGVYRYEPEEHSLLLHNEGDKRNDLTKVSLDQNAILLAGAVVVLSYDKTKLEPRYQDRAFRYACIEAGHIAQNALLVTESLGLAAVVIGAYHDDFVKDVLSINGDPIYMVAIGRV